MIATSIVGISALSGEALDVTFSQRITRVERAQPSSSSTYLAPAFVDLQVNGCGGVDYCSPAVSCEDVSRSLDVQFATGVTRLLATVITGPSDRMKAAMHNLWRAKAELGAKGDAIAGLHIEGPHLSAEDGPRGVHPRDAVRAPSLDEFESWQDATGGLVRMVTLAPEWPGALRYIEAIVKRGVVAAIGHTAATGAQIADAVSAGASMATHLGNATFPSPPKFNALWDQLADDRLAAGLIADGYHLPPSFLKTAFRAKSAARLALVTDAVAPAGAPPGRYRLGEVEVEMDAGGRVTLAGGTRLAGSSLRMDHAVGNMMRMAGATLDEAVTMATLTPARVAAIPGRQQGLAVGDAADLVEFTLGQTGPQVRRVWLSGRLVHDAL